MWSVFAQALSRSGNALDIIYHLTLNQGILLEIYSGWKLASCLQTRGWYSFFRFLAVLIIGKSLPFHLLGVELVWFLSHSAIPVMLHLESAPHSVPSAWLDQLPKAARAAFSAVWLGLSLRASLLTRMIFLSSAAAGKI